jgi:hypothetical protein
MKDDSIWLPLDDYISDLENRPTTSFYPSSASCQIGEKVVGECLRKQYWKWKGEPQESADYRAFLTFRLGKAYEQAFLEGYQAKGLLRAANKRFRVLVSGLPISGEIDGLTTNNEIIECKSSYGKSFFYSIGNKPKPEHLCQIIVYLACLGLDTCILPYGSRDDTAKRQGYRLRKRDIEEEGIFFIKIVHRWKILQLCLSTDVLPERDFSPEDWQCRYCGYRKKCYKKPKSLDLF